MSSPPVTVPSANPRNALPPVDPAPPTRVVSPPRRATVSPPKQPVQLQPVRTEAAPAKRDPADASSPPISTFKLARVNSKADEPKSAPKVVAKEPSIERDPPKPEKQAPAPTGQSEKKVRESGVEAKVEAEKSEKPVTNEESNGVGDKIKKFEKAAEDASASVGRMSRPGSVRGRSRTERLGSDSKDDLPPPATPFKDSVHFELNPPAPERVAPAAERSVPVVERSFPVVERSVPVVERSVPVVERSVPVVERSVPVVERGAMVVERQQSLTRSANSVKWQRTESDSGEERPRPEPQRIIKPEFKPIASPVDVTIRSPSLGAKIPDQFPSHGTAFRNVASPDPARAVPADEPKPCKFKPKEKYSVSKGSSYFTRGSEEIWLVKKKDIEEIEERVLDSFRRAGGGACARSESARPAPEAGQGAATLGRRRPLYARSESLDPAWAGARAHTLKRQSSVACTCGHDKKQPHAARAKQPPHAHAPHAQHAQHAHAHAQHAQHAPEQPRPRSRSHGDDNAQAHVLDKYETLV